MTRVKIATMTNAQIHREIEGYERDIRKKTSLSGQAFDGWDSKTISWINAKIAELSAELRWRRGW